MRWQCVVGGVGCTGCVVDAGVTGAVIGESLTGRVVVDGGCGGALG